MVQELTFYLNTTIHQLWTFVYLCKQTTLCIQSMKQKCKFSQNFIYMHLASTGIPHLTVDHLKEFHYNVAYRLGNQII